MRSLLLPPGVDLHDAARAVRQRLFVLSGALLLGPNFLWYCTKFLLAGETVDALIDGTGLLIVIGSVTVAWWQPRLTAWVCRVQLGLMLLLMIAAVSDDGGGLVLYWPMAIPVLAVFLFGRWEGLAWSLALLALCLPYVSDAALHGHTALAENSGDWVTAFVVITAFAVGYDLVNALAARAAERERERLADFAATSSDWFFELDADLNVQRLQGDWPNLDGRAAGDLQGQPLVTRAWRLADSSGEDPLALLRRGPLRHRALLAPGPDGEPRDVVLSTRPLHDADGTLVGVRGSGSDVTARVRAEQALRDKEAALHQADRMNTLGQLTSGIAHDFNNVLTITRGNLDLLREHLAPQSTAIALLDEAERATDSAAELNARLLDVARRPQGAATAIDVAGLLDEIRLLLGRSLGPRVQLQVETSGAPWAVHVQRSLLQSALLNLVLNARDAMPEGGRVILRAGNLHCPLSDLPEQARQQLTVPAPAERAHWLRLEVEDTGTGIPAAVLDRVFEPFFTTKAAGRGTGLGLAMVRGFVNEAGGWLEVDSREGMGTCMRLVLPAVAPSSTGTGAAADDAVVRDAS